MALCLLYVIFTTTAIVSDFRLKREKQRAYIFSLPSNTELTASKESNYPLQFHAGICQTLR